MLDMNVTAVNTTHKFKRAPVHNFIASFGHHSDALGQLSAHVTTKGILYKKQTKKERCRVCTELTVRMKSIFPSLFVLVIVLCVTTEPIGGLWWRQEGKPEKSPGKGL